MNHPTDLKDLAKAAARDILERLDCRPKVAMLLGTGHNSIVGQLKNKRSIAAEDLPDGVAFSGHSALQGGQLEGVDVVVTDAPVSAFEGHSVFEVTYPVRVLKEMGVELLILTAGAASLSQQLEAGSLAVVEDHINLSGIHPLHGPNDERLGPRFPDMSEPYSMLWQERARSVAVDAGVPCLPGIFAAVPGPSLPTRAEYRFLRRIGADLVGMSVVPEVVAAVHSGLPVLALVGITQQVQPESHTEVSIEAMLDAADVAAPRMATVLVGLLEWIQRESVGLRATEGR